MIRTRIGMGFLTLMLSFSLPCAPLAVQSAEAGLKGRGWRGARGTTSKRTKQPAAVTSTRAELDRGDVRPAQFVNPSTPHFEPSGQSAMPQFPPPAPGISNSTARRDPVFVPPPVYQEPLPVVTRVRTHYPRRQPSLWDRRKPSRVFLFYDTQARRIGDLITVVISENTDVDNRESRALDKTSDDNGLLSITSTTAGDFGASSASLTENGQATSTRAFDGSAQFSSDRRFSDRVTVTVVQMLPNGNLVLAGERRVMVAGDERRLEISGVVRPIDVRADNTVESRFVGNFQVKYAGDGVESRFTNQGWLARFTNRIWPF